jgi:cation diffusion facilitator CzcD-associated flavoprotein CzcO
VLLEAGSDLGGIWYWNCYPGARVDTHVPMYEFSDERVWRDWYWEERFPDWQALRRYFDHVDAVWDLRRDIRFDTRVTSGSWHEATHSWTLRTANGEQLRSRFVVLCTGFAAKPYVPDLPGLADFTGACHHTATWPQGGLAFNGLRVGILGTGASGVQVTQEAARIAAEVTVFQRTPMMALPMRQRRLNREVQDAEKGDYPNRFELRTQTNTGFDYRSTGDSTFSVSDAERQAIYERLWDAGGFSFWSGGFTDLVLDERANTCAYEFWRDRVRDRVRDPATAELLAPMQAPHPFGVKRPSLEQDFYDLFDQSNVSLVDLRTTPIEKVTRTGIRTSAGRHELDVLVLATGFDAVTGGLSNLQLRGTTGTTFREHWRDGVRTQLGLACSGFPNVFFLYGPQSPSGFCNGPTCAEVQGDWVIGLIEYLGQAGITRVEASPEAEAAWTEQVHAIASMTLFPRADSWYMGANVPGKRREMLNWPGGLQLYLAACRESADAGYQGFALGPQR